MVVLVQAREELEHRPFHGKEGGDVSRLPAVARRIQVEAPRLGLVQRVEQRRELLRRRGPERR